MMRPNSSKIPTHPQKSYSLSSILGTSQPPRVEKLVCDFIPDFRTVIQFSFTAHWCSVLSWLHSWSEQGPSLTDQGQKLVAKLPCGVLVLPHFRDFSRMVWRLKAASLHRPRHKPQQRLLNWRRLVLFDCYFGLIFFVCLFWGFLFGFDLFVLVFLFV